MKAKFLSTLTMTAILLAGTAQAATIVKADGSVISTGSYSSGAMANDRSDLAVEACSNEINPALNAFPSTTDRACLKRQDRLFRRCVINLTRELDNTLYQDKAIEQAAAACEYIPSYGNPEQGLNLFVSCSKNLGKYFGRENYSYVGIYCAEAKNYDYSGCVGTLSRTGINSGDLLESICNSNLNVTLTSCVVEETRRTGQKGSVALQLCREKLDPEIRAQALERQRQEQLARAEAARKAEMARQAELARKAELARQAEVARQNELARQAEIARQAEMARQAELAKKADLARQAEVARQAELARQAEVAKQAERDKQAAEEAKRKEEEEKRKQKPQQPAAPAAPGANGDGGVIVDLPNL